MDEEVFSGWVCTTCADFFYAPIVLTIFASNEAKWGQRLGVGGDVDRKGSKNPMFFLRKFPKTDENCPTKEEPSVLKIFCL